MKMGPSLKILNKHIIQIIMKLITQNQFCKVQLATLFVFMFGVVFAFANPSYNHGSALRILLPANGNHTVYIDNMPYHGIYNSFKTENIKPGNHRIKIVQVHVMHRGRTQIVNKNMIYNGVVFIPAHSKVLASVNYNGRLVIEHIYHPNATNKVRGNHHHQNNNYERNRDNNYTNERSGHTQDQNYNDGSWYDEQEMNDKSQDRDQKFRENETHSVFAYTLQSIKNKSFDSERLKIAKHAAATRSLVSSEVVEIAKLFTFESTRLDFAKYAYEYTIDKKNYVIVYDAFQFSSSTSELQDYIAKLGH